MKSYMMGTIAEKVPCELKDNRQQGSIIKTETYFGKKVSAR